MLYQLNMAMCIHHYIPVCDHHMISLKSYKKTIEYISYHIMSYNVVSCGAMSCKVV